MWVVVIINHDYKAFFLHFKALYKYKLIKIIIMVTITEKVYGSVRHCIYNVYDYINYVFSILAKDWKETGRKEKFHCVRAGVSKYCLRRARYCLQPPWYTSFKASALSP